MNPFLKHPMKSRISILCLLSLAVLSLHAQYTTFVDPHIGSEGQGLRVHRTVDAIRHGETWSRLYEQPK